MLIQLVLSFSSLYCPFVFFVNLARPSLSRGSPQVEAEAVPEVSEKMEIAMVPTFVLLKV